MRAGSLFAFAVFVLAPLVLSAVLFRFAWEKIKGPERELGFGSFAMLSGITCLLTAVAFGLTFLAPTD